jgi:hypothetical protein
VISFILHSGWGLTFIVGLAAGTLAGWVGHREFGRELRRGPQRPQERPALPPTAVHAELAARQQAAITAVRLQRPAGALEASEARRHA